MIQTKVTPKQTDFDMPVSFPVDYIGKEVHVLFYIDEEIIQSPAPNNTKQQDMSTNSFVANEVSLGEDWLSKDDNRWDTLL